MSERPTKNKLREALQCADNKCPCVNHARDWPQNALAAEVRALQAELKEAHVLNKEMERVKDKAFLCARDADGSQRAAFEMLTKAKNTIVNLQAKLEVSERERDEAKKKFEAWEKDLTENMGDRLDVLHTYRERARKAGAELAKAKEALKKIRDLQWTPENSGAGPIDATPNEKGLLRYVGQANEEAKKALAEPE